MSVPRHFLCIALAVAALGAAGCGGENAEPVTVYAAASLRDAFIAFHSTSAMIAAPTNAMRNSIGTTSAVEVSRAVDGGA